MKLRNTTVWLTAITLTIALLTGCSGKNADQTEETGTPASEHLSDAGPKEGLPILEPTTVADSTFRKEVTEIYRGYLKLKEALVASDVKAASAAIKDLRPAWKATDASRLSGAALSDWKTFSESANRALTALESAADLDAQRAAFSPYSDELYKTVRAFGLHGMDTYYAYCPMALNNKGAYWLSGEQEIRNPYFGESMLNCGRVSERRH